MDKKIPEKIGYNPNYTYPTIPACDPDTHFYTSENLFLEKEKECKKLITLLAQSLDTIVHYPYHAFYPESWTDALVYSGRYCDPYLSKLSEMDERIEEKLKQEAKKCIHTQKYLPSEFGVGTSIFVPSCPQGAKKTFFYNDWEFCPYCSNEIEIKEQE